MLGRKRPFPRSGEALAFVSALLFQASSCAAKSTWRFTQAPTRNNFTQSETIESADQHASSYSSLIHAAPSRDRHEQHKKKPTKKISVYFFDYLTAISCTNVEDSAMRNGQAYGKELLSRSHSVCMVLKKKTYRVIFLGHDLYLLSCCGTSLVLNLVCNDYQKLTGVWGDWP